MEQLLLHLIGDYVTQSDWMAQNKRRSTYAAAVHASFYGLPFLFIGSLPAVSVIMWTHFFIDRFAMARYLVFAKNFIVFHDFSSEAWPWPKWEDCKTTGYPSTSPPWLSVWLMIIADNTLHMCINYAALRWL